MTSSPSAVRRMPSRILVIVLACALAGAAATPARAGLGSFVKAAKDKAANAVGKKAADSAEDKVAPESSAGGGVPKFDDMTLELTNDRVEKVLAGLIVGREANIKRAALAERQRRMQEDVSAIYDKYGHEMDTARRKHDMIRKCWDDFLNQRNEAHEKEMQTTMMSDPVQRQKFMAIAQELAKAQSSGDQAAVEKVQQMMMKLAGATHEDTVAAQQRCGAMSPLHPMEMRVDSLRKASSQLDKDMRAIDEKSIDEQSRKSGLTVPQFAMARERIELWLSRAQSNQKSYGVTPDEMKALDAHRKDLAAALNPE